MSLLVLEILLAPLIIAQTILQLRAGMIFTLPEILGPMIGFVVLAAAAAAVLAVVLRPVPGRAETNLTALGGRAPDRHAGAGAEGEPR